MARAKATDVQAVVQAAAEVFHAKGFRNATIDDIASAANISRPTVYSYAKSKQWLFDRVILDLIEVLEERLLLAERRDAAAWDRMAEVVRTHVDAAVEHGSVLAIMLNSEVEMSSEARTRFRAWARSLERLYTRLIEDCIAEGSMDPGLDPRVAAQLLLTMLTSLQRWYKPRSRLSRSQLTDQILLLVGRRSG